jgi:GT2 family glycosyltransferase
VLTYADSEPGGSDSQRIWVGTVELAEGFRVAGVARAVLPGDTQARVWVRLHGAVLGSVEVPVQGGVVGPEVLGRAVEAGMGDSIALHMKGDGLAVAALRLGDALPRPATCSAQRRDWNEPISVIVATKDRPGLVGRTLASLQALDYDEYEVLLIDGTRDDSSKQVFESVVGSDNRFRYIAEAPTGLSMARNLGIAEARYDYGAFTDDDCVADPLWLDGVARGFGRDARVACVTGIVPSALLDNEAQQYFDGRVWWSASLEPHTYTPERGPDDSPLHPFRAGIFGTGANFALDLRVAEQLGGFSRLLGVGSLCRGGGEDGDMFVRVLRSGHLLAYEPSAIVWHEHRGSSEALRAQLVEYGRGIAIVGLKWLSEPETRGDVLRRVPSAVLYYGKLLFRKGYAGESKRAPMALAEARGVLGGPLAFARGYRAFRRLKARRSR